MKPSPSLLPHLPALDGLRGVAALLVLMHHSTYGQFSGGVLGVDVFFVLSGFLITKLMILEEARHGALAVGAFYARRALRLLPALVALVVLAAATWGITASAHTLPLWRVAAAALFYHANLIEGDLGALTHTWSLAVEEHFYIVWPLVFVASRRINRRVLFAALWAGALAVALVGLPWVVDSYRHTMTRVDGLLVGSLLATLRIPAAPGLTPIGMALILGGSVLGSAGPVWNRPLSLLVQTGTALVIVAAMGSASGATNRFLNSGVMRWAGSRSYGIYLYHLPLIFLLEGARVPGSDVNFVLMFVARVGLTALLAEASFRWLETPFLQLRKRWTR